MPDWPALPSALLAISTTGTSCSRSQRPISSSSGVSPARASITNSATSAPLSETSVCARIRPGRVSASSSSQPAVSTAWNSSPSSPASPNRRSRVTPGWSSTSANFLPTSRLNKVDLPTFGLPMITTWGRADAMGEQVAAKGAVGKRNAFLPRRGRGTTEGGGGARAATATSGCRDLPRVPLHHPSGGSPPRSGEDLGLPAPAVGHARPRLLRLEVAVLQQLDRDPVGRAHECHVPVARRAVDRHPGVHQLLAGRVDVVDAVGEVAEVAPAGVVLGRAAVLGRPVPRQLDLGDIRLPRRGEEE